MSTKQFLDKDQICKKAIELIEKDGLENLSMRKLADKLHVKGASLYNHISSKSELYDLIQEFLYSQMKPIKTSDHWQKYLIQLAKATRRGLLQFPNIVPLFATRPTMTQSFLKQIEQSLKILIKAGFRHADALIILTNINVFTLGHVLAETGRTPGESDNTNEPSLMKMNIDHYPTLKKAMSYKSSVDFNNSFRQGVENMVDGLMCTLKEREKK